MGKLVNVAEVDALLASEGRDWGTVEVCLAEAAGRILGEPLHAPFPFPSFDRAMMDGVAVSRASLEAGRRSWRLVGHRAAGAAERPPFQQETEALGVATGAAVPAGLDQVLPKEGLSQEGEKVRWTGAIPPLSYIQKMGSDAVAGERILPAGSLLGSREMAAVASCGRAEVVVKRRPRLALLGTGKELVRPGQAKPAEAIYASNGPALGAALWRAGVPSQELPTVEDAPAAVEGALRAALDEAEVLVVTGAVSVGPADYVAPLLTELLGEPLFHGVRQRPGKPMGVWRQGESGCFVFGLPGNPQSALVGLHRHVLPWIHRQMGWVERPEERPLTAAFENPSDFTRFLPVSREGAGVRPEPAGNSGEVMRLLRSEGFLELPPEARTLEAGESFPFRPWL
ncbi:MAG: molybdopterin molybdotransferase MoeA [Verrucomicrobiota bacterium]